MFLHAYTKDTYIKHRKTENNQQIEMTKNRYILNSFSNYKNVFDFDLLDSNQCSFNTLN